MPLEETTQIAAPETPAVTTEAAPPAEVAKVETPPDDGGLAAALKEAQERLSASAKRGQKAEPSTAPKTDAKTEEKPAEGDKPAEAKTDEKKPEDKPAPTPEEELAKFVAEQRRASAEKAAARREKEEAKREREELARQREAMQKGQSASQEQLERLQRFEALKETDPAAAVELLMGRDQLGELVYPLLSRIKEQGEDGTGIPESDRQRSVEEQIAEGIRRHDEELQRAAAEQQRQQEAQAEAQRNQRREAYFSELQQLYRANRDKFPYLMVDPVDVPEVESLIQTTYQQTGKVLEAEAVLSHFNKQREDKAIKLAEVRAKLNPTKSTSTPLAKLPTTPKAKVDSGAAPVKAGGELANLSPKEQIARRIEMLNQLGKAG
ncbi:MAG: hypothetical protein KGP14_12155 [Betaproteobacteria bacterium]|nr:hypothetical protein [Betaproteobacteria bacterium]